jgi:5'-nucleotidase
VKLLLVNDDGIDAPGLAAMERAVTGLGTTVVVAPDRHLSGCGHRATTHDPLTLTTLAPDRHMLDGTPADCTRIGLAVLAAEVDWVIAGVNEGGNLGADVYMSGTVAAVREGALLGKPGIAVSHYVRRGLAVDWQQAAEWTTIVLRALLARPTVPGAFWNVNLPHHDGRGRLPPVVECPLDFHPLPVQYEERDGRYYYRGRYQERLRTPGTDVDVCFSGHIAVTRLSVATGAQG